MENENCIEEVLSDESLPEVFLFLPKIFLLFGLMQLSFQLKLHFVSRLPFMKYLLIYFLICFSFIFLLFVYVLLSPSIVLILALAMVEAQAEFLERVVDQH